MALALNFFNPKFLLTMMLLCLLAAGVIFFAEVTHAWTTHGADADQAENCMKQNGFQKVYRALKRQELDDLPLLMQRLIWWLVRLHHQR